ncbi:MAG: sulfite exporter TauE/SafE family protein [Acidobacteriota bacterium]
MDYYLILTIGFFTSFHCIGMCGPIVIAYSTQALNSEGKPQSPLRLFGLHLSYNTGRFLSYSLLGAAVGAIGGSLVSIKGASSYISIFAGALMIISGIILLKLFPIPSIPLFSKLEKVAAKTIGRVIKETSVNSKFILGFFTALFPCGILYAMLFKAAATQSALSGALTMLLFSLGMAPALIITGMATSLISAKIRAIGDKIAAITIIIMGITLLLRGFHIPFMKIFGGAMHHGPKMM